MTYLITWVDLVQIMNMTNLLILWLNQIMLNLLQKVFMFMMHLKKGNWFFSQILSCKSVLIRWRWKRWEKITDKCSKLSSLQNLFNKNGWWVYIMDSPRRKWRTQIVNINLFSNLMWSKNNLILLKISILCLIYIPSIYLGIFLSIYFRSWSSWSRTEWVYLIVLAILLIFQVSIVCQSFQPLFFFIPFCFHYQIILISSIIRLHLLLFLDSKLHFLNHVYPW